MAGMPFHGLNSGWQDPYELFANRLYENLSSLVQGDNIESHESKRMKLDLYKTCLSFYYSGMNVFIHIQFFTNKFKR